MGRQIRCSYHAAPTAVLTPTMPLSAWNTVPGLEDGFGAPPLSLAPSDPRIAYRLIPGPCGSTCPGAYTLSESVDAGAHWSPRTLPSLLPQYQRGGRNAVFLTVSPVQPQVLILATATAFPLPATCPSAAPGGVPQTVSQFTVVCWIHFYSADGGQSWRQITLPVPGLLMATPQARGTALYATVSNVLGGWYPDIPTTSIRLVESHDGGQTWRTIDGALASAEQDGVNLALVPASSILYAVTRTMGSLPGVPTLWRSEDDGVVWQHVPVVLPTQDVYWLSTGVLAGERQLALYIDGGAGAALTPQVFASTDGGPHWVALPSAELGIEYPVGNGANLPLPGATGAVLADGALLEPFEVATGECAFFAWTPGQSQLQPIGSPISGSCQSFLLVPAGPGGTGSLWVVSGTASGTQTAWLPLADA